MRCYIAVMTAGRTEDEIMADVRKAEEFIRSKGMEPYHTIGKRQYGDPALSSADRRKAAMLKTAERLREMSVCDAVYFCSGYERSRAGKVFSRAAKLFEMRRWYADYKPKPKPKSGKPQRTGRR